MSLGARSQPTAQAVTGRTVKLTAPVAYFPTWVALGQSTKRQPFERSEQPRQMRPIHWYNLCFSLKAMSALNAFWTASRGDQVISCEFIVPGHGQPILRCAFGPQSVIRSQCIASADAAAEVAETWKAALVEQGFRIVSRPLQS